MAKKQFKAESKRLMDLMINSIYTHKEIFLREIISNASDAIDKLAYLSLTDDTVKARRGDLRITVTPDKEARTLTVSDNGVGMSEDELEKNLGTIARSGSLQFKADMEKDNAADIIGQFGVGFYSAFMVADEVTVITRRHGEDAAHCWKSSGADGYTVTQCEKAAPGTDVIMHLKPDTEDEDYHQYLQTNRLQSLIKKYSDYIRHPIRMEVEDYRQKEKPEDAGDDYKPEWETVVEEKTINSMVPLWQRPRSKVKQEEYDGFYQEKFNDWQPPLATVTTSSEGTVTFKALLFVPSAPPYDFYTREYEKGLQLYSSGVLIMDKCADLLPDCFRFVKGVVDSPDFSLNISREMLQHDRQLKIIATALEKKIKNELVKLMKDDREKYEKFWSAFGRQLKYSVVDNYGAKKELLQDLLLFTTSKESKLASLSEYVERMAEGLGDLVPHRGGGRVRHAVPGRGVGQEAEIGVRPGRPARDRRGKGGAGEAVRGEQARAGLRQGDPGRAHQGGPHLQDSQDGPRVHDGGRPHVPGDGKVFLQDGGRLPHGRHEGRARPGAEPRLLRLCRPERGLGWRRQGPRRQVCRGPLPPGPSHRGPAHRRPRRLHRAGLLPHGLNRRQIRFQSPKEG